jgi:RNA polymerase-binding transcription factor DksA
MTTTTRHESLCEAIDAASLDALTAVRRLRRDLAQLEEQLSDALAECRAFPDPQDLYDRTEAEVVELAESLYARGYIEVDDALLADPVEDASDRRCADCEAPIGPHGTVCEACLLAPLAGDDEDFAPEEGR